jgi:superfamily II DNA or RNA helicase
LDKLVKEDTPDGGVVVAGIHQLYCRIMDNDDAVSHIIQNTGAVIIDEAHRADTKMYDTLFIKAEELCGDDLFPVCGLTATPGRADNPERTQKLVGRFDVTLITPQLDESDGFDPGSPLKYFKENGYLARAIFQPVKYNHDALQEDEVTKLFSSLQNDYLKALQSERQLSEIESREQEKKEEKLLKYLAWDITRNTEIIKILCNKIKDGSSTLVYTCSVEHASVLSTLLNRYGRKSACVSAKTSTTERRMIIDDFRKKRINFLFNYGVLTTGFDAPKTDHIVLCRPIANDVLYEQIVGRGMRGPKFTGTEECRIIDFEDSILEYGLPQSYIRCSHFWDEEEKPIKIG